MICSLHEKIKNGPWKEYLKLEIHKQVFNSTFNHFLHRLLRTPDLSHLIAANSAVLYELVFELTWKHFIKRRIIKLLKDLI